MAYLETPEDDQQKLQQQGGTPNPLTATGGGSPLDPAGGAAPGSGPALPGEAGGARPQFAELDTYLRQNQPAAQQLGGRVAGEITKRGDTARQAIQTGLQGFQADVGGREVQQDAGLLNLLAADPIGLSKDASRKEAFQKQRDASYSGPAQLEDTDFYSPISSSIGEAKRYGDLSQSSGGVAEILGGSADRPYSSGARAFDASLALGDPTSRAQIEGARSSLSDIDSRLADASAAARARVQQAQQTTAGTSAAARGALSNAYTAQQEDLNRRLAEARQQAVARSQAALGALQPQYSSLPTKGHGQADLKGFNQLIASQGGGAPDANVLADLGITPEQFASFSDLSPVSQYATAAAKGTKNVNPYSYLDQYQSGLGDLSRFATVQSPESIQLAQLASPDDYARLAALNDLSGEQQNYLDPALADQAGTANLDLTGFDFNAAQAQREAALEAVRQRAQRQLATNSKSGGSTLLKKVVSAGDRLGRL
jgi:hypothetical protein